MAIFVASKWIFVKKAIAGLIIILLLAPAVLPSRAYAVLGVGDVVSDFVTNLQTLLTNANTASSAVSTWKQVYTEVAKAALKVVARKALKEITVSTVNWANQGFEGKPLFLQNPDSFFTDIEHDEIKETVNEIGGDPVNFPWGRGIAINKVREARGKSKSTTKERIGVFDLDTRFDLNSPEEIEQFYSDTRIGGWDGWTAMINNPNNNPIGFDLAVSNDLSKQEAQKTENWEKSIQGMILPMQKCADPSDTTREMEDAARNSKDMVEYERVRCKRWEDTTPSSLVADKISHTLTSGDRQSELSAALGSSLSQVFSALLDSLIDKGLSALATNTIADISPDDTDTWSFEGESFSFGQDDDPLLTSSWADETEVIDLDEFKTGVQTYIDNVNERINLTQQIVDIMGTFGEKSMTLDQCLPGPDIRWEKRFSDELRRESKKMEKKSDKNNDEKAADAMDALARLETAARALENYMKNRMLSELPNSFLIMDWLKTLGDRQRKLEDYEKRITTDREKLARLNSIKNSLDGISEPLDDEEKNTIKKLWGQYQTMKPKLPKDDDVAEAESEKGTAEDWEKEINNLNLTCLTERDRAGYPPDTTSPKLSGGWEGFSERENFCNNPIETGGFKMGDKYIYPNQIEVNADKIYNDNSFELSCDIIYYSHLSDYDNPDE